MADPVSLAITVALNAATMAMTMMNKMEGPRLEDLTVTTADYGTPLAQFYGTKRLELPCFYAEEIREEKEETKGKGGKYTQYKYFGTWANFIADHEIKTCLKAWFDRHLILDRTRGRGPIAQLLGLDVAVKLKAGENYRFYKGTETQSPDPRMLAKITEREGPGRCPAYLGVAYVVFEEVPLEKFGNRLPQASGIFTRPDPINAFPYEIVTRNNGLNVEPRYSADRTKLIFCGGAGVDVWALPNREMISSGASVNGATGPMGVQNDGSFYSVTFNSISGGNVFLCSPYGASNQIVNGRTDPVYTNAFYAGCELISNGFLMIYPYGLVQNIYGTLAGDDLGLYIQGHELSFIPTHFFPLTNGAPAIVGRSDNYTLHIRPQSDIDFDNGSFSITVPNVLGYPSAMQSDEGPYVVYDGLNTLYRIDNTDGSILQTLDLTGSGMASSMGRTVMAGTVAGAPSIYFSRWEVSTDDLSVVRVLDFTDWVALDSDFELYDPTNNAIICDNFIFGSEFTWRFLDRQAATGTQLGDICADVAVQAGFDESEFNFDDLDQNVLGFSFTQGPAKDVVGALLEIHDSDIGPHEWIQRGLKRGQQLSGPPITSDWMIPESGEDGGRKPLWKIPITSETDLPREVYATFSDPDMEEQPNTARSARSAVSVKTKRIASFDLQTLSILSADMGALLDRALRRYWVGATKPECRVSPLEIRIEPGDVRMFQFEEEWLRCRVLRTNIRANRVIDLELEVDGETPAEVLNWELDAFSPLNTIFAVPTATTNGRDPDDLSLPVPTKGFLIDVALLRDADDQTSPFINTAAGRDFTGFWPGASVWVADGYGPDTEFAAGWDSFSSDQYVTWGVVGATALGPAIPDVIDYGNEIEVFLPNDDALSTITEDAMLDSQTANLAVIGNEVVQFMNAVQIADRRYTLSGFIRGARGTERYTGDHLGGERFVLIGSNVRNRSVGANEIGDTDFYKFITLGYDGQSNAAEVIELEFAANAHRPLAPADVVLAYDSGTASWTATWTRRTRVGGSTVNGQDVPLGETTEQYRVKVYDPADPTGDPVRTVVTTDPEFEYTSAMQTEDFGAAVTHWIIDVCQLSPVLSLEGFVTRAAEVVGPPIMVQVGELVTSRNLATLEIDFPDDILPNDVAIIQYINFKVSTSIDELDGDQFTLVEESTTVPSQRHAVFAKRCTGQESGTTAEISHTITGGSNAGTARAIMSIWRGVQRSGSAFEGEVNATGADATAESAAVVTTGNGRTVINAVGVFGSATITEPAGYTVEYDETDVVDLDESLSFARKQVLAPSTEGPTTTNLSGSYRWSAISFALKPRQP